MKTISLAVIASFLLLSGLALASQSGEQKDHSSMMQEMMMKGGKPGEHKDGMMRMMKMMDQCAAMMESAHSSEADKQNRDKDK